MSDAKTVLPETGRVPLWNAPIGLFKCDGELCLKTEYRRNDGWIEAYIVSSGEAFWGPPPQTLPSQTACLVEPVDWEVIEGMTGVLEVALRRTQAALAASQARVEASDEAVQRAANAVTEMARLLSVAEAKAEALDMWMRAALARWEVVRNGDENDVASFAISLMQNTDALLLAAGEERTTSSA